MWGIKKSTKGFGKLVEVVKSPKPLDKQLHCSAGIMQPFSSNKQNRQLAFLTVCLQEISKRCNSLATILNIQVLGEQKPANWRDKKTRTNQNKSTAGKEAV